MRPPGLLYDTTSVVMKLQGLRWLIVGSIFRYGKGFRQSAMTFQKSVGDSSHNANFERLIEFAQDLRIGNLIYSFGQDNKPKGNADESGWTKCRCAEFRAKQWDREFDEKPGYSRTALPRHCNGRVRAAANRLSGFCHAGFSKVADVGSHNILHGLCFRRPADFGGRRDDDREDSAIGGIDVGRSHLVSFALLYLPSLITTPPNGGLWTNAGKALALAGGCFLVAGSLPLKLGGAVAGLATIANALEKFIPLGRFFLAAFLILGGIEHFIYVQFVSGLVPSWIPGHNFWTYFAGVALIAGGIGICIGRMSRLAAILSGLMIFLWLILLHIPRAMADLSNSNETTAVFEALAFSGAAFLVAASRKSKFRD